MNPSGRPEDKVEGMRILSNVKKTIEYHKEHDDDEDDWDPKEHFDLNYNQHIYFIKKMEYFSFWAEAGLLFHLF